MATAAVTSLLLLLSRPPRLPVELTSQEDGGLSLGLHKHVVQGLSGENVNAELAELDICTMRNELLHGLDHVLYYCCSQEMSARAPLPQSHDNRSKGSPN